MNECGTLELVHILPLISYIALASYLVSLGLSFLICEIASCRILMRIFNEVSQEYYSVPGRSSIRKM